MAFLRNRSSQNKAPSWEQEKDELVYKVDLAGFPPSRIEMEQKVGRSDSELIHAHS